MSSKELSQALPTYNPAAAIIEATTFVGPDPVGGPEVKKNAYGILLSRLWELVGLDYVTYEKPPTNEELIALMMQLVSVIDTFQKEHGVGLSEHAPQYSI